MESKREIISEVEKYYSDKIRTYGTSAKGVDWNSKESQELRFKQLLTVIDYENSFSVLDFGCGYGALFDYMNSIYSQFTFSMVQDRIVKIELDSSRGNTLIKDTSVKTEQFFPDKNPFTKFSELTSIIKKYGLIGSAYSSEIGDFFIF